MSSQLLSIQDSFRFKKRKARFSFSEVHILLDEVRKHRCIVVGKYNRGVPTDVKKRTWAEIAARVNEIGECQREVIEVIKKWSDLKCDTKRKVSAMRGGTVPHRGLNSRLCRDLNPTEKIVLQILEMNDDDKSRGNFAMGDDDDEGEEEEDDMIGMRGSPNSGMPPPTSSSLSELPSVKEEQSQPTHSSSSRESSQPPFETQCDMPTTEDANAFADSDDDQRDELLPSTHSAKLSHDQNGSNGVQKQHYELPQATAASSSSTASQSNAAEQTQSSKVSMLQSVSLSLQEQHATNMLLETISRSLELLSESVQQLAETQQEFVRESLVLQRETVDVLRDFTSGAIALLHDKLNGRPAL